MGAGACGGARRHADESGGGVSNRQLDFIFVGTALFAALGCARYYVVGVLDRDRLISRTAAAGFFVFTIAAVLYFWRFF
jgi:hypothetical protein